MEEVIIMATKPKVPKVPEGKLKEVSGIGTGPLDSERNWQALSPEDQAKFGALRAKEALKILHGGGERQ